MPGLWAAWQVVQASSARVIRGLHLREARGAGHVRGVAPRAEDLCCRGARPSARSGPRRARRAGRGRPRSGRPRGAPPFIASGHVGVALDAGGAPGERDGRARFVVERPGPVVAVDAEVLRDEERLQRRGRPAPRRGTAPRRGPGAPCARTALPSRHLPTGAVAEARRVPDRARSPEGSSGSKRLSCSKETPVRPRAKRFMAADQTAHGAARPYRGTRGPALAGPPWRVPLSLRRQQEETDEAPAGSLHPLHRHRHEQPAQPDRRRPSPRSAPSSSCSCSSSTWWASTAGAPTWASSPS